jgi:phthalate 4,5-cis-dihydrodiol dehydrogenase
VAAAERNRVYLLYGHTHSYNPPIRKMREFVRSGELGRLTMMQAWNYTDLLYRPRAAWELDTTTGGGVVYIQASHQVDMLRWIGGGLVRSVRGMTGVWDAERPTEGSYTAYLEFVDGTPATIVYNGYAHFDTAELHYWLGERGLARPPDTHARTLAEYRARHAEAAGQREAADRDARRYGGSPAPAEAPARPAAAESAAPPGRHQYFFGLVLVSCQKGDLRQSPDGLYLYGEEGKREIAVPLEQTGNERMAEELYQAIAHDRPPTHDGRWGRATMEVCLALLQSARERREVYLSHQVPTRD